MRDRNLSLNPNPLIDLLHEALVTQKPLILHIVVFRLMPRTLPFGHKSQVSSPGLADRFR